MEYKLVNVYLAGTVTAKDYRQFFLDRFANSDVIKMIDPIKKNSDLLKKHGITETDVTNGLILSGKIKLTDKLKADIVEADKKEIDRCQILVAFIEKFTVGTLMEIMYAYTKKIPVLIINPNLSFKEDVWLYYHAFKVFVNVESCAKFLEGNY